MKSSNEIANTGLWNDYKEFFAHIDAVIAEENRPAIIEAQLCQLDYQNSHRKMFQTQYTLTYRYDAYFAISYCSDNHFIASFLESGSNFWNAHCYGISRHIWCICTLKMTLTMIIATFPILIGLGVDYALHMVNRLRKFVGKGLTALLKKTKKTAKDSFKPKFQTCGTQTFTAHVLWKCPEPQVLQYDFSCYNNYRFRY